MVQSDLPKIGQPAPVFSAHTQEGDTLRFPECFSGKWCVFFSHPANFTASWLMYSRLIAMKERIFSVRNTALMAISHELVSKNDLSETARRCVDIFFKGPIIQDTDFRIADLYGLATLRKKEQDSGFVAFILDPSGIIRYGIENPQPSIENIIRRIESALFHLQSEENSADLPPHSLELKSNISLKESPEVVGKNLMDVLSPVYFNKKKTEDN